MTQYTFNNIIFTNKSKVDDHIRGVKNQLIANKITKIEQGSPYFLFFTELLDNHHDRIEKIGAGVEYFYFVKGGQNEDQLRIQRLDHTNIECSYTYSKIIKPPSYNYELNSAMRFSIENQIQKYKKTLKFPLKCNICVGMLKYYEIDHILPFDSIKREFLIIFPQSPTSFDKDSGNTCRRMFKPENIDYETKWNEYHEKHATYQVLCKTCNGKKGKKIY
jgi:hypothetical protein